MSLPLSLPLFNTVVNLQEVADRNLTLTLNLTFPCDYTEAYRSFWAGYIWTTVFHTSPYGSFITSLASLWNSLITFIDVHNCLVLHEWHERHLSVFSTLSLITSFELQISTCTFSVIGKWNFCSQELRSQERKCHGTLAPRIIGEQSKGLLIRGFNNPRVR